MALPVISSGPTTGLHGKLFLLPRCAARPLSAARLAAGGVLRSRAQGELRPGGYRYHQGGCYLEQPGGWQEVSPRYCGVQAQYAPPARVYDDTPRCMRSPSYNPRRGTFIDRDGYERPCP